MAAPASDDLLWRDFSVVGEDQTRVSEFDAQRVVRGGLVPEIEKDPLYKMAYSQAKAARDAQRTKRDVDGDGNRLLRLGCVHDQHHVAIPVPVRLDVAALVERLAAPTGHCLVCHEVLVVQGDSREDATRRRTEAPLCGKCQVYESHQREVITEQVKERLLSATNASDTDVVTMLNTYINKHHNDTILHKFAKVCSICAHVVPALVAPGTVAGPRAMCIPCAARTSNLPAAALVPHVVLFSAPWSLTKDNEDGQFLVAEVDRDMARPVLDDQGNLCYITGDERIDRRIPIFWAGNVCSMCFMGFYMTQLVTLASGTKTNVLCSQRGGAPEYAIVSSENTDAALDGMMAAIANEQPPALIDEDDVEMS